MKRELNDEEFKKLLEFAVKRFNERRALFGTQGLLASGEYSYTLSSDLNILLGYTNRCLSLDQLFEVLSLKDPAEEKKKEMKAAIMGKVLEIKNHGSTKNTGGIEMPEPLEFGTIHKKVTGDDNKM